MLNWKEFHELDCIMDGDIVVLRCPICGYEVQIKPKFKRISFGQAGVAHRVIVGKGLESLSVERTQDEE